MSDPVYVHVCTSDLEDFVHQVNAHMIDGYMRDGDVWHEVASGKMYFAQTLIKPTFVNELDVEEDA